MPNPTPLTPLELREPCANCDKARADHNIHGDRCPGSRVVKGGVVVGHALAPTTFAPLHTSDRWSDTP